MWPYFSEQAGNPSSNSHTYGWAAAAAVQRAREIVANSIGAIREEIVFTSGATEANNLAIKGVAEAYLSRGRHIVTVQTEHSAVLAPCRYLESLGFEVTYLPVQPDGLLDLAILSQALRPDTILVSVMAANNEIGVLQPLQAIGQICRQHQVLFHTDAAQAIGKVPLNVDMMGIDLLSITAHKIYGPKGVGALYVRRRNRRLQLSPQLHGGGQEGGLRAGTLATPQIVGLAAALEIALAEQKNETQRLTELRQRLWQHLQKLEGVILNGHPHQCLPGCLSVTFTGIDGAALLLGIQPVLAVSSGSACSSANPSPSHVLIALGHSAVLARATLRFGIGRSNTPEEMDQAAKKVIATVRALRQAGASFF